MKKVHNRNIVIRYITDLVIKYGADNNIKYSDNLMGTELDSLDSVEIIMNIEMDLNITITDADSEKMNSIEEIVNILFENYLIDIQLERKNKLEKINEQNIHNK